MKTLAARITIALGLLASGLVQPGLAQRRPVSVNPPPPKGKPMGHTTVIGGGPKLVSIGFEELVNGHDVSGSTQRGTFKLTSSGANAGLAIFDSSPDGPNQFSSDPDLLVGTGNVLILQSDQTSTQSAPGVFDIPNDDRDGGTITFTFLTPRELVSIDLVDICPDGGACIVTLSDSAGRQRVYDVAAGYTNDVSVQGAPGHLALDLATLATQSGVHANATASEDPSFDPSSVLRLEVFLFGSGAVDSLVLEPDPFTFPQPALTYGFGESFAVVDLDQDCDLDVILVDRFFFPSELRVLENQGDGRFVPSATHTLNSLGRGISTADMDGNGTSDLVVVEGSPDLVSVLLNDGTGSLTSAGHFALTDGCQTAALADLNGDGIVDVAVSPREQSGNTPAYFLGLGDGSLGTEFPLVPGALNDYGPMLVDDLNLDGHVDLIMPKGFSDIAVWFNDGTGSFPLRTDYDAGGIRPDGAALIDMDVDGDRDLVVANETTDDLSVLTNELGLLNVAATHALFNRPAALNAVDYDDDGDLDVFVSGHGGSARLTNDGGALGGLTLLGQGLRVRQFAGADVDKDGDTDLLTLGPLTQTFHVTENLGGGEYHLRTTRSYGGNAELGVRGDFNGDGRTDLVWADQDAGQVLFLPGTPRGSFGTGTSSVTCGDPRDMAAADLDGDGDSDLVVPCRNADTVSVLSNQGDGSFFETDSFPNPLGPEAVTIADFDGNGELDFAATAKTGGSSTSGEVIVFLNSGGAFVEQPPLLIRRATGLTGGDLNGDGTADLVVPQFFEEEISVLFNDGSASFGAPVVYGTPGGDPIDSVLGDYDGDGSPDVAIRAVVEGCLRLFIFYNDGSGSLTGGPQISTGDCVNALVRNDVDGDGIDDLLYASFNGSTVSVLRGKADQVFERERSFLGDSRCRGVFAWDLSGDGRKEIVTFSDFGELSVFSIHCR